MTRMVVLIYFFGLLACCCWLTGYAFIAPSSRVWQHHANNRAPLIAVVSRREATIDKQASATSIDEAEQQQKERLSTEEEEILFGEAAQARHPPYPDQHRTKDKFGNILPDHTLGFNPVLEHSSRDPVINKLHTMRGVLQSCPELWLQLEQICPDRRAILDEHLCDGEVIDLTFAQMSQQVQKSASVFTQLGVKRGVNVAILGENSALWLLIDHGIQMAGGASAVRGADAPLDELRYIYEHSDSAGVVVLQGPNLLKRLAKDAAAKKLPHNKLGLWNAKYGGVKTVILMHREKQSDEAIQKLTMELGVEVFVFANLLATAAPLPASSRLQLNRNDLATIVYTSGTTGHPKGVVLSHGNLLHQTGHRLAPTLPYEESEPLPGECMVSLLPVWHITERSFELWMASRGCSVIYSSIRTFKNDLAKYQPQWMVLVPRVLEKVALGVQDKFSSGSVVVRALSKLFTWSGNVAGKHKKIAKGLVVADETPGGLEKLMSSMIVVLLSPLNAVGNKLVWSKVQAGFGGQLKVIISGGSALAGSLEQFYETAGFTICVGYGLTECSPLISYRRSDANLVTAGCTGKPCLDTELRVVDPEIKATSTLPRQPLPDGQVGVVIARGPQVMQGYYKNPEATAAAVDAFGWFDTGDLGRFNPATGDLILTGRAKDTIVLSNGENIEPTPIEDSILGESDLVEQVMLTGQDGRRLIAIVVLNPKALAEAGFLDRAEAERLQKANEKVNDPKCSEDDCIKYCQSLHDATEERLRSNEELKAALVKDVSRATAQFRKWEQVGGIYLTLEPFAMANGQLTQSYKVKRDAVLKRYEQFLPQ